MKVATKINYEDVIDFFEGADLDLANLTHQLVTGKLNSRIEKREALGERLSKARKARKPKGQDGQAATEATPTAATEPVAEGEQHRGPGRPRAVSA
jgi:hypothetical protein